MNSFLLNPARMTFQLSGVLGGLLLPGRKGEGPIFGNGDCILLDGDNALLGIADGSERSPQASRKFLQGLSETLTEKGPVSREDPLGSFLDAAHAVLGSFHYEDRTTFICILSGGEGVLHYICGGDSLLFHIDREHSRIRYRNRANMGFSGRSTQVVDSGRIQCSPGDLLFLTTDGAWDLTDGNGEELIRAFFQELKRGPFHLTTERLVQERHPAFQGKAERPYDDFSAVLVDPYRIDRLPQRVIMGGTDDIIESKYQLQRSRNRFPDQLLPLTKKDQGFWSLPEDFSHVSWARE